VVVNNFHVAGAAVRKAETDASLIVDPDAVLSAPVAFQQFDPVVGRHAQRIERRRGRQILEFPDCYGFDVHEASHATTLKKSASVSAHANEVIMVYGNNASR
jgi:hypothetical protein